MQRQIDFIEKCQKYQKQQEIEKPEEEDVNF